jgi:trigger factor
MRESYTLKLEGKEWKELLEGVYKKKKKDVKMDGFRKGNVPYNIYIKNAGIESLFMDASDEAVNVLYKKLMADEKTITPVATPNIEIKSISIPITVKI